MTPSAPPVLAPRLTYAGVLVLALSIILFEISLTRVFAIMMWHHLTYMVVSIALLGFGAAGSLLTARMEGQKSGHVEDRLAAYSIAYGFSVMFALCFVTNVNLDSLNLWQQKSNFFALLLIYLIITVPFLFGGLAIGTALTRYARQVNSLYFADLLGSAIGGGVSVLALRHLGASSVIFLAGSAGVFAGFLFAIPAGVRATLKGTVALVAAVAVAIGVTGGSSRLHIPSIEWTIPFAPNKEARPTDEIGAVAVRIPSATAQVEVSTHLENARPAMGGEFGVLDQMLVGQRGVSQDGTAPTAMFAGGAHVERFPFLDDTQAASAYKTYAAVGGKNPDVLVIGVGGGVDVMVALFHQANSVDAAEINTAMIEMVTERYDDYLDGLFRPGAHPYSDRLNLVNAEGRSYLRHSDKKYDVIQMSGVDSFTALSTGAYTLSESYLYTVEAVKEFYAHLKDGGYVNYSRFILTYPRKPRETLRLSNIAYTALRELGVEDPKSHIVVFCGHGWASTMIKRGAFTRAEIDALTAFAHAERFRGLVFDPLLEKGAAYPLPADAVELSRAYLQVQLPLAVPSLTDPEPVLAALAESFEARLRDDAAGAASGLSRALAALGDQRAGGEARVRALLDTAHTVANDPTKSFWQTRQTYADLLHADDAERARFVADYDYDITPCRDDTPFFFNYYRYRGLLPAVGDLSSQDKYHYEYPVGHVVLLASMLQIVVIAFVLLILPLRRLAKAGVPTPGKLRYFVYFAALGMGFMFVELALMQKLVIFLGHPTYALSVVLTAILGFAGLGSFLGGRFDVQRPAVLWKMMLAIVVVVGLTALALDQVLPALLGYPFSVRVAASLLLMLPVGLVLGMPFPAGVRLLEARAPQLIPWAWAINGFLSVFSSIFCIVLSMQIGFTKVFLIAAVVYVVGFVLLPKPRATTTG